MRRRCLLWKIPSLVSQLLTYICLPVRSRWPQASPPNWQSPLTQNDLRGHNRDWFYWNVCVYLDGVHQTVIRAMARLSCKMNLVEVVDDSMYGVKYGPVRIIFAASFQWVIIATVLAARAKTHIHWKWTTYRADPSNGTQARSARGWVQHSWAKIKPRGCIRHLEGLTTEFIPWIAISVETPDL